MSCIRQMDRRSVLTRLIGCLSPPQVLILGFAKTLARTMRLERFDFLLKTPSIYTYIQLLISIYSKKRKAPEGFYGFTTFRQRKYLTDGEYNLNNKDFILGWGYQFIPQNFVTADVYYGIGGRVKKFNYNDTRVSGMGGAAIFLIGVRIGFKII